MRSLPKRRCISFHGYCKAALALSILALSTSAQADELLKNGNFEAGTFTGWSVATEGNGDFFLSAPGSDTPAVSPDSTSFYTAANPEGRNFFAVSASGNPGAQALIQDFVVKSGTTPVQLSFQMFVNDQSYWGGVVDPSGLDYTTGGTYNDNQHARVDLLRAGASDFSTDASDVLANFYLGVDNPGGDTPNPYQNYSFDISSYVSAGGTYRLRFADVNNLGSINLGVDNVSIQTVPESSSLVWLFGCIGGAGFLAARRNSRRYRTTVSL